MAAPLTPEQVATLVSVYDRTGNYSEAGRAIGVPPNTARDAILRNTTATRRKLHARACEATLRRNRKRQERASALIDKLLDVETNAGVSLEPRDIAALVNSLSRSCETAISISDRDDRRRQSRLTRQRTRAETELTRAKTAQFKTLEEMLRRATPAEIERILGRFLAESAGAAQGEAIATGQAGGGDAPASGLHPVGDADVQAPDAPATADRPDRKV